MTNHDKRMRYVQGDQNSPWIWIREGRVDEKCHNKVTTETADISFNLYMPHKAIFNGYADL